MQKTFLNDRDRVVNITIAVIIMATTILVGWDIVVALNDVKHDTISRVLQAWAFEFPVIPFLWGILGGHWFWPRKTALIGPEYSFVFVMVVVLIVLLLSPIIKNVLPMPIWCVLGFVIGHYFWPMNIPL